MFNFRNNKRVAAIWLDEYNKYFLARHPDLYAKLDVGDISEQLALKDSLKCKPFSHFLQEVAPDMLERFPLEDYAPFASGSVSLHSQFDCFNTEIYFPDS